ncbi:hypothetical protein NL676_007562 [Syzygium grande]|nr:hypothetical protein NL676_007562 [Syzygium grande]
MRKLYRRSVTVHPSPPPPISDHSHLLSLLPAAILALTAALSPQDREVLAYLISGNNGYFSNSRGKSKGGNCDHPPCFTCDCFRCYMSYWVRWDSSPNRQLIHEIIDAFEDGLVLKNKNNHRSVKGKNGRDRRRRSGLGAEPAESKRPESNPAKNEPGDKIEEANPGGGGGGGGEVGSGGEEELEKGSVRRLVSFIGERIWGVWN